MLSNAPWILRAALCGCLVLAIGACGSPEGAGTASIRAEVGEGPLFPFEPGRRWTYTARWVGRSWLVDATRNGGDVRELDGEQVDYDFVYADLDDEMRDVMKSIYAMAPAGPREFYVDAFHVRLEHEPPVPILPPEEPAPGQTWTWTGSLMTSFREKTTHELTTTLRVIGVEEVATRDGPRKAVRIDETAQDLRISRWFAPGVGMARLEVESRLDEQPEHFELVLQRAAPPAPPAADAAPR